MTGLFRIERARAADLSLALERSRLERVVGTERRLRSGRFDPRSAIRAEYDPDDDRLFRRTVDLRPRRSPLRVVLDLDASLSTTPIFLDAVSAVLVVVEALRRTGDRSAVVTFADRAEVVKNWTDPLPPLEDLVLRRGRTDVATALEADRDLFRRVGPGPKVVVVLTDGRTRSPDRARRSIAALRASGVHTLGLRFGPGPALGEDRIETVDRPSTLVPTLRAWLTSEERRVRDRPGD